MVVGYVIAGNDNDSYFFDQSDNFLPVCGQCGYVTDPEYFSPKIKLINKKYDISSTYDNRTIVSSRFKDFCETAGYTGLDFRELPNDHHFYHLTIKNFIKFDVERANLNRSNFCMGCGNYESVTPGLPVYLIDVDMPLSEGFYATDTHFASGNEKVPLFIVGVNTYKLLKGQRFKGINFLKISV